MLKSTARTGPAAVMGNIMSANIKGGEKFAGKSVCRKWVDIQQQTFTNWSNYMLTQHDPKSSKIENLFEDLKDGHAIMAILENCLDIKSKTKSKRKPAKHKIQERENLQRCFKLMSEHNIKLVNIGPGDIHDGNSKLILGFIWTLISKFSISILATEKNEGVKPKDILLRWLSQRLGEHVEDFGISWRNGVRLTKLVNHLGQEVYENKDLLIEDDPGLTSTERTAKAMETASRALCVPAIIGVDDMCGEVRDEHSTMAYLALFKNAKKAEKAEAPSEEAEEDEDQDEDGLTYGTPANFSNGGTGIANLKTHMKMRQESAQDLYAMPPVKNKPSQNNEEVDEDDNQDMYCAPPVLSGGKNKKQTASKPSNDDCTNGGKDQGSSQTGGVAAMRAKWGAANNDSQGSDTKANLASKIGSKFGQPVGSKSQANSYNANEEGSYRDIAPGDGARDHDDGTYRDVCPNPDSQPEKVKYTSIVHNNEGSYKDVTGSGPNDDGSKNEGSYKDVTGCGADQQEDNVYRDVCPNPDTAENSNSKNSGATRPSLDDDVKSVPPSQRPADWREYKGENLGGRCKIRVYFSTTTCNHNIRKANSDLQDLLEGMKVHLRDDFEPWIPIDVDMDRETRNKIFEKAGTRITPLVFVDDEFLGGWDTISELREVDYPGLQQMFEY